MSLTNVSSNFERRTELACSSVKAFEEREVQFIEAKKKRKMKAKAHLKRIKYYKKLGPKNKK